jgi:hypothetical protein
MQPLVATIHAAFVAEVAEHGVQLAFADGV